MGIFITKEIFNTAKYAVWKIDEPLDILRNIKLSESDIQRLDQISNEKRLAEFLAIRHCLKSVLGTEQMISYTSNGKPFLSDSNLSVSFSHTNGFAGVIIGENMDVGIDLELKRDNIQRIAPRFMRENEYESISESHPTEHLLFYWGAKEAVVKIEGNKKLDFIKNIHVEPFEYGLFCESRAYLILEDQIKNYTIAFENHDSLQISCGKRIEP